MSKPVDLELKKAFAELHVKMLETSKKIQVIDTQMDVLRQVMRHVEITQHELGALPPDTKTYETVGRMFLRTDLDDIKRNLKNKVNNFNSRTDELRENKFYLEKSLKESQDNLREMVQQKKEMGEKAT
ncbi:unnamed protein product [Colias eurytheme]|nr:unnamed protein product [Colias eurytheme]